MWVYDCLGIESIIFTKNAFREKSPEEYKDYFARFFQVFQDMIHCCMIYQFPVLIVLL